MPATRARDPLEVTNDGLAVVVLEVHTEHAEATILEHLVRVHEVALLEEAGDFDLLLGHGHVHPLVGRLAGVPDAGKHVRDGVGHHGSVFPLPARLANARDLTAQRHLAEADTADAELPDEGAGTTAPLATVPVTHGELLLSVRLFDECLSGHSNSLS